MSFGEEEIEESEESAETNKKLERLLDEGKKLKKNSKFAEASLRFYKVVESSAAAASSYLPEAKFELGRSLLEMGLYESSLSYLAQIAKDGKSHPYYRPAFPALLRLMEKIPEDRTLLKRLAKYAEGFPENIGPEFRKQYAFRIGRYLFNQANPDDAIRLLSDIERTDPHYAEAKYIQGVSHVSNYDAKPAVDVFKKLLEFLVEKSQTSALSKKYRKIRELAWMGMARVFYSTGDYQTSLKYFRKIPRDSVRWPKALLEMSWAYFQTDNFNRALGNLHTLNSPYFKGEHMPEAPILSAVIYFYNCRYERVRRELDNFDYYYQPIKKRVNELLGRYSQPSKMYDFVKRVRAGDAQLDEDIERLVEKAFSDREVGNALELVETIQQERKQLQSMPADWKSSALGSTLLQEIALAKSFALNDIKKLSKKRLERIVKEIENLEVDKQEILYEVARAEKGNIETEVKAGMRVEAQKKVDRVKASDEHFHWRFSGPYWRDELGRYRFSVTSKCQR
jgi:tetratricopeptide (TPR) repeat protein